MLPFSAALRDIARIPGARYSCVADGVTGDVLAEHGQAGPDPAAAVRWGTGLRTALRPSGELEDVMIAAEATYHLLRLVRADDRTVLVHVSVDRARGNLALARRALGDVRFDATTPAAPQRIEVTPASLPPRALPPCRSSAPPRRHPPPCRSAPHAGRIRSRNDRPGVRVRRCRPYRLRDGRSSRPSRPS